jgi:hypothetical protein
VAVDDVIAIETVSPTYVLVDDGSGNPAIETVVHEYVLVVEEASEPIEVGIPGPQGAQGDQGPAGDRGADGYVGADGAPGAKGDQGNPGADGEAGPAGIPFPLVADADFAKFKSIAMCCDNGTSFPASPATAQWFYRSDLKTLFQHEGGWRAIISFGAVALYVDGTLGTDAVGQGYSAGAGATRTVQYAVDLISPISGGNVVVIVAAGTYREQVTVEGKLFSGPYSITILGALTLVDSGTVTTASHLAGNGPASWGLLTDASKAWVTSVDTAGLPAGGNVGMLLVTTGVSGGVVERIIDAVPSSTQLRVQGCWTKTVAGIDSADIPAVGAAYSIYNFATRITGANAGADTTKVRDLSILVKSKNVVLKHLTADYNASQVVQFYTGASGSILSCHLHHATANPVYVSPGGRIDLIESLLVSDNTGGGAAVRNEGYIDKLVHCRLTPKTNACLEVTNTGYVLCIAYSRFGNSAQGLRAWFAATAYFRTCNYVHNNSGLGGLYSTRNSYIYTSTSGVIGTLAQTLIENNSQWGAFAEHISEGLFDSFTYLTNTLGTYTADSTSTLGVGFGSVQSISANTTLSAFHDKLLVSGAVTITLPTAVGRLNKEYTIKKVDAGTTLTLATTSGQTIDGAAPGTLTVQWQSRTFLSNGANWLTTDSYL